jgi:hypothetical protein
LINLIEFGWGQFVDKFLAGLRAIILRLLRLLLLSGAHRVLRKDAKAQPHSNQNPSRMYCIKLAIGVALASQYPTQVGATRIPTETHHHRV